MTREEKVAECVKYIEESSTALIMSDLAARLLKVHCLEPVQDFELKYQGITDRLIDYANIPEEYTESDILDEAIMEISA